jgi:hypothetical protein
MGPKMNSLSLRYFWAPSCATASSRPCGSDRQVLEGVEARSAMLAVDQQTRAFLLLLRPSPSFSLFQRLPAPAILHSVDDRRSLAGTRLVPGKY